MAVNRSRGSLLQQFLPGSGSISKVGKRRRERRAPGDCELCREALDLLNALRAEWLRRRRPLRLLGVGALMLHARHREGGIATCRRVVRRMVYRWSADEKMREYLTLDTLFRPGKFDKYAASDGPVALLPGEERTVSDEQVTEADRERLRRINEDLARRRLGR